MNKSAYIQFVSKVNFGAFLALLAALPYPLPIIRFCWMAWVITWVLELRFLHRENIRRERSTIYLSIGVAVWLLWNMMSVHWASNPQAVWASMERYAGLLAIPLVGIWGVNQYYNLHTCIKVLLVSFLISIGVYMFTHYWVINYQYALNKHAAVPISIDWVHMDGLLMDIKHRMHYTNWICMLFPCLFLVRNRIGKWWAVAAGMILLCAMYMTGSRAALVNALIIVAITACWVVLRKRSMWAKVLGIGIAVLLISGSVMLGMHFHPRNAGLSVQEMIHVDETNVSPAFEPRFAIWKTALEQPQDYMAYGLGAGNSTDYLMAHYTQYGWEEYIYRRFSAHNQYLGVCMELGLVAAILFALFWVGIPFFFKGTQRYWALCATGMCLSVMMTDMLLTGLEGIVFVSLLFVLGQLLPDKESLLSIRESY